MEKQRNLKERHSLHIETHNITNYYNNSPALWTHLSILFPALLAPGTTQWVMVTVIIFADKKITISWLIYDLKGIAISRRHWTTTIKVGHDYIIIKNYSFAQPQQIVSLLFYFTADDLQIKRSSLFTIYSFFVFYKTNFIIILFEHQNIT